MIGREQNSYQNFKNLNLIKIYLIMTKDELKKRLIKKENQNTTEEIDKRSKLLTKILSIGKIMIMLLSIKI